jgi:hypothetical protein
VRPDTLVAALEDVPSGLSGFLYCFWLVDNLEFRIMWTEHFEEHTRRKIYDGGREGNMVFIPRCTKCGQFIKADKSVMVNGLGELKDQPNATCSNHGRVSMPFEGFFSDDELGL